MSIKLYNNELQFINSLPYNCITPKFISDNFDEEKLVFNIGNLLFSKRIDSGYIVRNINNAIEKHKLQKGLIKEKLLTILNVDPVVSPKIQPYIDLLTVKRLGNFLGLFGKEYKFFLVKEKRYKKMVSVSLKRLRNNAIFNKAVNMFEKESRKVYL